MSRLTMAFQRARTGNRAAFIAYVTAGDPTLERTSEILAALERAGTDVIELGVPFSDPIADGPTNQLAAERALAGGTSLADVLDLVRDWRSRTVSEVPIILFTYANPVVRYGVEDFAREAAEAGVDGILFTDVPEEESSRFAPALHAEGLSPIMLVTPTSGKARIKSASRAGGGFLYLVSRTGVTGARQELDTDLQDLVARTKKASRLPVAVGFGISTPHQVTQVAEWADGVVVGSAIVDLVGSLGDDDDLSSTIEDFVRPLVDACGRG